MRHTTLDAYEYTSYGTKLGPRHYHWYPGNERSYSTRVRVTVCTNSHDQRAGCLVGLTLSDYHLISVLYTETVPLVITDR
jgi:hypothetical protein